MPILVTCNCGKKFRADEKHAGKQRSCPKCGQSLDIAGPYVSAYDVFVSYSSKDKTTCDALCATFEGKGLRCWIAPRDILPGANWGEAIIGGIEQCQVMVLVFSAHSNESPQVKREVERAVSKGIPVIPLRIEDVKLSRAMEYFISSQHWLDALTPPLEKHLEELTRKVIRLLTDDGLSSSPPSRSGSDPIPTALPVPESSPRASDLLSPTQPTSSPNFQTTSGAAASHATSTWAQGGSDLAPNGPHSRTAAQTTWWTAIPQHWRWIAVSAIAIGLILWAGASYFKSGTAVVHATPESSAVPTNLSGSSPNASSSVPVGPKLENVSKTHLDLNGPSGVIATWFEIGEGPAIHSMAFSPDGRHCLIGQTDDSKLERVYKLGYWDVATGRPIHTFKDLDGPVTSVSFSPDGSRAVSVAGKNKPILWDLLAANEMREYDGPGSAWRAATFAPDGRHVLVGCEGSPNLIYWDTKKGTTTPWVGHKGPVISTAFSGNGARAISGDSSGGVFVWNVATGERILEIKEIEGAVTCVRLSRDGQIAYTGNYRNSPNVGPWQVRVWSLHGAQPSVLRAIPGTFFEISADGTRVLSNGEGNAPHSPTMMIDFKKQNWGESTYPCESPRYVCTVRSMTPDGRLALIAGQDRRLLLWRLPK